MQVEKFYYDNKIVRNFAYATVLWGVVGMLVGLIVALQLVFPAQFPHGLNFAPWLNFGRLRPLHTNAVIFAFVGNGILWAFIIRCSACVKQECSAISSVISISGAGN